MSELQITEEKPVAPPRVGQVALEAAEIVGGGLLIGTGLIGLGEAKAFSVPMLNSAVTFITGVVVAFDGSKRSNRNVRLGAEADRQRKNMQSGRP